MHQAPTPFPALRLCAVAPSGPAVPGFIRNEMEKLIMKEFANALIIGIAAFAHHVNRSYCMALGDNTQPVWDEAPDWQRQSAMQGVIFHIKHPDAGPSASHDNWMAQKLADGWTYGPEKNPELKQHPCMVPFEQLSTEQKAKDYIFQGIVHEFMVMYAHIPLPVGQ